MSEGTRSAAAVAAQAPVHKIGGLIILGLAIIALGVSIYHPGNQGFFGPVLMPRAFAIMVAIGGAAVASGVVNLRNPQDFFGGIALVGLAIIGMLASVVGAYYYLAIIKIMYFDDPAKGFGPMPAELKAVLGVTGLFNLLFAFYPGPLVEAATAAANRGCWSLPIGAKLSSTKHPAITPCTARRSMSMAMAISTSSPPATRRG